MPFPKKKTQPAEKVEPFPDGNPSRPGPNLGLKAPNAKQKKPNTGGGLPFFNPTKPSKKKKAPMKDYDQDGF